MSKRRKSRPSRSQTIGVAVQVLTDLNTEFSLHCADLLKTGHHAAYLEQRPSFDGDCWRTFFKDYQASELLSKFDGLNLDVNRELVALEKFEKSENDCRATNARFWRFMKSGDKSPPFVVSALLRARRKIETILGDFSWDEAVTLMDFGPGASVGLTRKHSHSYYKFGLERPTTTGECAVIADLLIGRAPQWSTTVSKISGDIGHDFSVVVGSRITTVPKNAKTDRVIAIEPLMNMYVQKGIGGCLRRRLRSVGVDLNSQSRNQELAKIASIRGDLATVDLRAASDTVSFALVEWLFPDDWLLAMKVCRSKSCVLPSGEVKFLQKFSSMGNGFTFELESLIFWAISVSVAELCGESSRDISIYGDDIIFPSRSVSSLFEVLSFAGFEANAEKTFWEGPFRESCGKHYFLGHDVTPMYIRKDALCSEHRKLWLANSIRRLAYRLVGHEYGCYGELKSTYDGVCRLLDRNTLKLSIPEGFGDGGLVRDFDEALPRRHRSFDGYVVRHLLQKFKTFCPSGQPCLTLSLHRLEKADWRRLEVQLAQQRVVSFIEGRSSAFRRIANHIEQAEGVMPIEVTLDRYSNRIVKSVAPRWEDLGPWVCGF